MLLNLFEWEVPEVHALICQNFRRIVAKDAEFFGLLVENGIFEQIWHTFCQFHVPGAMDLLCEGFFIEEHCSYFVQLVQYPEVVSVTWELSEGFCANREVFGKLLCPSFSLLSHVLSHNGYTDVIDPFVQRVWEIGGNLFVDANIEIKQEFVFFVLTVFEEAPLEALVPGFELFGVDMLDYVAGDDTVPVRAKSLNAIEAVVRKAIACGFSRDLRIFTDGIIPFLEGLQHEYAQDIERIVQIRIDLETFLASSVDSSFFISCGASRNSQ
jgi:hypothetical protein